MPERGFDHTCTNCGWRSHCDRPSAFESIGGSTGAPTVVLQGQPSPCRKCIATAAVLGSLESAEMRGEHYEIGPRLLDSIAETVRLAMEGKLNA